MDTKEQVINQNFTKEQAQNLKNWDKPATEELKEAVVSQASQAFGIDKRDLVDLTTAATPADITDSLFMKIKDGQLFSPEYKFELTQLFKKKTIELGNEEYKYAEYDDSSDDLAIDADNTMADFNGDYVDEYAEVYRPNTIFHNKVKVPELVLSNAWLAAQTMVEFVDLQIKSMAYAIERRWENLAWTSVFEQAQAIELPADSTAIEYNKAIVNQMEAYKTTSDEHFGIGTNGVITVNTVTGAKTLQPDLFFDPKDFTLFVDTEQFVDVTFENDAQWYNYAATKIENWGAVKPIAFSKYKGFKAIAKKGGADGENIAEAVELPAGLKMIAIHKDSIELLEQFLYTETLKGRGPWKINHVHSKIGSYKVKTKPIITIVEAAAPEGSTSK